MKTPHQFETLLRADEVQQFVPFSRQHIHRMEQAGQFPRRLRLGARRVAWRLSDITAWLEAKAQASAAN